MSEQFDHEIEEVLGLEGAQDPDEQARLRQAEHKAHAIAGAIYGTILATTVVAALGHGTTSLDSQIVIVVFTSFVFYAAHVYSLIVAGRMVAGRPLTRSEIREVGVAEWPMLQSSWPIVVPLLLGAFGVVSKDTAAYLAMFVGIGALFVYGVLLGVREGRGRLNIVWNAFVVGSFGVLILLLKIVVH